MIPLIENISIELNENIINQNYQKSNYIKKESKKSFNEEFKTRQNSIINDLFIPNQLLLLYVVALNLIFIQKIIDIPLLILTNKTLVKFKYLLNIYFAT